MRYTSYDAHYRMPPCDGDIYFFPGGYERVAQPCRLMSYRLRRMRHTERLLASEFSSNDICAGNRL